MNRDQNYNNHYNNEYYNYYINNYNNYYRDYINYLYSTNSIIQQNITLLQNNCDNLYYLNRYYLNQYNLQNYPNNNSNVNYESSVNSNYNTIEEYNNTSNNSENSNYISNPPSPNLNEYPVLNDASMNYENSENVNNNGLQNIFRQIFNEITLMENHNIYIYILDNCITYSKFYEIENPMNEECPINQSEFNLEDDVIMINNCNHIFNPDAIKHWFKSNHTCPLCRNNLIENTDYQPQSSYQFRF